MSNQTTTGSGPLALPQWPASGAAVLVGMTVGLALFYRSGALPAILAGLAIFGALALLRPEAGLLFVPLTMPLYLIPASVPGVRATGFLLPVHEVALLVTMGACAVRLAIGDAGGLWSAGRRGGPARPVAWSRRMREALPLALLLLAGISGVLIAVERSAALREFRWTIAEPLIFYALMKILAGRGARNGRAPVVVAFVLGGALVGLLGLLQFAGYDVVEPLLGRKLDFAENIVPNAGLRRVTSVFGHPNNLGLYLERVWPVAVALAVAAWMDRPSQGFRAAGYGMAALLCIGGEIVSFSRGAWLGSAVALAILVWPGIRHRVGRRLAPGLAVIGAVAVIVGLALSLRGGPASASTSARLLLWRESLTLIAQHPPGLGLDQFYYYHNPAFGRSIIDDSLKGTSEQYAAHPHNLFLDVWLRLGPPGLIAFGWLITHAARRAHPALRAARGEQAGLLPRAAFAALASALTHGLVDNFYFLPDLAISFWLLLVIIEHQEQTPAL